MSIMRIFSLLIISLCLSLSLKAQEHEIGLAVGATAYQGDLVDGIFDFNELNIGYGFFYRFYASSKFAFRTGINTGKFTADDANADDIERTSRGFSMETTITEFSVIVEWNFLGINIYGPTAYNHNRFSPYLMLGVGAAMYNPTVTTTNTELRALDSNKEYPAYSMVIPMGIGAKYATDRLTIGIEGGLRAGLTDYLDGVSKSGDSEDNDWYGFYGINAAYRIGEVDTNSSPENPKSLEDFENTENNFDSEN